MSGRRFSRRQGAVAVAGLVAALGLALALGGEREPPPASTAALNAVAARNEDAAIQAASRMRAESKAAAHAADARQQRSDAVEPAR